MKTISLILTLASLTSLSVAHAYAGSPEEVRAELQRSIKAEEVAAELRDQKAVETEHEVPQSQRHQVAQETTFGDSTTGEKPQPEIQVEKLETLTPKSQPATPKSEPSAATTPQAPVVKGTINPNTPINTIAPSAGDTTPKSMESNSATPHAVTDLPAVKLDESQLAKLRQFAASSEYVFVAQVERQLNDDVKLEESRDPNGIVLKSRIKERRYAFKVVVLDQIKGSVPGYTFLSQEVKPQEGENYAYRPLNETYPAFQEFIFFARSNPDQASGYTINFASIEPTAETLQIVRAAAAGGHSVTSDATPPKAPAR